MLDLASDRSKSLSKSLLDNVDDNRTGLEIYTDYFKSFVLVDEDTNLSSISRFENFDLELRSVFYKLDEPAKEPTYFSFHSHHDVNRLSSVLDQEIVIYFFDDTEVDLRRKQSLASTDRLEIFHDFRGLQSADRAQQKVAYFVFTTGKRLFKLPESADRYYCITCPFFALDSEYVYSNPFDGSNDGGYVDLKEACRSLLGAKKDSDLNLVNSETIKRASDFVSADSVKLYAEWQVPCLIVYYCRNNFKGKSRSSSLRKSLKNCYFTTLTLVTGQSEDEGISALLKSCMNSVKVLCIYNERFVCILDEPFRTALLQRHLDTTGLKETLVNRGNYFHEIPKTLSPAEIEEALLKKKAKEAAKLQKTKGGRRVKKTIRDEKLCGCNICAKSEEFDCNMSKFGPEKLCTINYSIRDLLKMLGSCSSENEEILDQLCEWSIASMDIESRTCTSDMGTPAPGPTVSYLEIDSANLEAHVKKVQRPLMIAHVDAGLMESSFDDCCFVVDSDSESSVFAMMERYWAFVLNRRVFVKSKKKELAKPLLALIDEYKKAFFEFIRQWTQTDLYDRDQQHLNELVTLEATVGSLGLCKEDADALRRTIEDKYREQQWSAPEEKYFDRTWYQTLPGKLEVELNKLLTSYQIFSFYG